MLCPVCTNEVKAWPSYTRSKGPRTYRRYRCSYCTHKWSTLESVIVPQPRRKFTDTQIMLIRSSFQGCRKVARTYHVSPSTIKLIRQHRTYKTKTGTVRT